MELVNEKKEGCLGVERRQRGQKREKSFQSCLLLLELLYAVGRWNGYGEERVEKDRKSFRSCLLRLELQCAAGRWNGYAGER